MVIKKYYNNYFNIHLLFIIIFPIFPSYFGLFVEGFFSLFLILSLSFFTNFKYDIRIKKIDFYIFYFISMFLLAFISLTRSQSYFVNNDILELFKYFYFLISYVVILSYLKESKNINNLVNFLVFSIYPIIILFGLLESFTSTFDSLSQFLYKGYRNVVSHKAVFSFISPYTYASVLIFPAIFYFLSIFHTQKGYKKYILLFLLCVSSIAFSQSRTVFITLILSLFVACLIVISRDGFHKYRFYFTSLILSSCILFFSLFFIDEILLIFNYLYTGLSILFEALLTLDKETIIYSTPSISNRYEQLLEVINVQDDIPLIGAGIFKGYIYPESFYSLYLLRYGSLGLFLYFIFLATLIFKSVKSLKPDDDFFVFRLSFATYCLTLPISYFSSAINDQLRSGFIFILLSTILIFISSRQRNYEN